MRVVLRLAKGAEARFVSHLELARALERAARRAGLPVAHSGGFNPRPRLSLCSALAVGATSEGELVEMHLAVPLPPREVAARLGAELPAGLRVLGAGTLPADVPPLAARLRWARWRLLVAGAAGAGAWAAAAAALLAAPSCPVERRREGRPRTLDARPLVHLVTVREQGAGRAEVEAVLRCAPEETLRPEELVQALAAFLPPGSAPRLLAAHRVALLGDGPAGSAPLWEEGGE